MVIRLVYSIFGFYINFFISDVMLFYYDSVRMRYRRIPAPFAWLLLIILMTIFVVRSCDRKDTPKVKTVMIVKERFVRECLEFNRQNVYDYIVSCGIKHPDIAYRQALMESGFSSNLLKKANNLFGMRVAHSRPTTAKGEYNGFAKYDSWMESVQDYALYQAAYMRKARTREQYFNALDDSYCVGHGYSTKLRSLSDEVLRKL